MIRTTDKSAGPESTPTDSGVPRPADALPEFDLQRQTSLRFDGKFLRPGDLTASPNPMMPLLDAVCTRRTSRAYSNEPVDRSTFEWLVRYSMEAPTACNEQQWKIILIEDAAIIDDLYRRGSSAFLPRTRQCFLLCYNRNSDNHNWSDHIQSGAAFITVFQMLAHSIGVGSCWLGHLPNKSEMRRIFKIHRIYEPIALVTFGHYRGKVKIMPRKREASDVIMRNRFVSDHLTFQRARRTFVRTVGRWAYYKVPTPIRRRIRHLTIPHERKFYYETFD